MKNRQYNNSEYLDVTLIDILRIGDYLNARGWVERQTAMSNTVRVFEKPGDRLAQVRIPVTHDLSDFVDVLAQSISVIAECERQTWSAVYEKLLYYADDVVLISEASSDTKNGTVSINRAENLILSIRRTLISLAHLDIKAERHYPQMRWKESETFIGRCRFGQTRRGSFVITICCPLNAVPSSQNPDQTAYVPEFTRRVTNRLVDSVKLLSECAANGDLETAIQTRDQHTMLSSNLCDSLYGLAPDSHGDVVNIGMKWASKRPRDNESEPTTNVALTHEMRPFIETVGDRLRTANEPRKKESFFGRVETLAGVWTSEGNREGNVLLRLTDEKGDTKLFKVYLREDDHKLAHTQYLSPAIVLLNGFARSTGDRSFTIDDYSDFQVVRPREAAHS